MNLPKDGTNQLPKAGFDWIALKVIFQGQKGINLPLLSKFATYCPFIQNLFSNFTFILASSQDGDNELWREGFYWIILKVIAKVRKVRFVSFSHIYVY